MDFVTRVGKRSLHYPVIAGFPMAFQRVPAFGHHRRPCAHRSRQRRPSERKSLTLAQHCDSGIRDESSTSKEQWLPFVAIRQSREPFPLIETNDRVNLDLISVPPSESNLILPVQLRRIMQQTAVDVTRL